MKKYNWGIIGPGKIAAKFATALSRMPNCELIAIASRDIDRAKIFAEKYQVKKYYDSYETLAADPEIDIVYIASPHTFHYRHTITCLTNKKAVLCEKPMSVNYNSTLEMVTLAKKNNVFLMEAMWTRFLPVMKETLSIIEKGEIGEVKFVRSDFGFSLPFNPASRIYDMKLGGGALLDIGVYPLFLALQLLGEPAEIKSFANYSASGSDETISVMLSYKNNSMATIFSTVAGSTPIVAEITGSRGSITIQSPWYKSSSLMLQKNNEKKEIKLPYGDNGFEFEIEEVTRCLDNHLMESPMLPLDFSLLMSKIVNQICDQCKLKYEVQ